MLIVMVVMEVQLLIQVVKLALLTLSLIIILLRKAVERSQILILAKQL
jgi:hypothetical protein